MFVLIKKALDNSELYYSSEYEMLGILSKHGVAVVWNCNAKSFLQDKKLQVLWDSKQMPNTEVYLCQVDNFNTA
jgi:hypothetical protein